MWVCIRLLSGKPFLAAVGTRDAQTTFSNPYQVLYILQEQENVETGSHDTV